MSDEFVYRYIDGPGYMVIIVREVTHIFKCISVELERIRCTSECYNNNRKS